MSLITNTLNPWGDNAKHAVASITPYDIGDSFYLCVTPDTEERNSLCFVAKDKNGIGMLIAILNHAIRSLEKLRDDDGDTTE